MSLSPEIVSQIVQLWADGISVNQIGKRLNISKNTVCGRVHRMGLPRRNAGIRRTAEPMPIYYGKLPTLPTLPSLMDMDQ